MLEPLQPFAFFEKLKRDMDELFNHMFQQEMDLLKQTPTMLNKRTIHQTKDEVILRLELPDMDDRDEIHVQVEPTLIHVFGQKHKITGRQTDSIRNEFHSRFSQTIPLPTPVIAERAVIHFNNGIVTVKAPKESFKQRP